MGVNVIMNGTGLITCLSVHSAARFKSFIIRFLEKVENVNTTKARTEKNAHNLIPHHFKIFPLYLIASNQHSEK